MSKYDAELRRRILSGEKFSSIGKWYIECMANEPTIRWEDFSPVEMKFWIEVMEGFDRWMKGPGRRH
jgi:hypothetical protein